jgi:hypothetical protein
MNYPPCSGSMISRSLARLLRAERMTHLTFQKETHTYRLAVSIERLRNKYGWPIASEKREGRTNDPVGRNTSYCVYYLPISAIQANGSKGHDYALKIFEWEKLSIEGRAATHPSKGKAARKSNITKRHINISKGGENSNGTD